MKLLWILGAMLVAGYFLACTFLYLKQRSMLYFPTHYTRETELRPWIFEDRIIGYCREVERPTAIWLMTHGNGGQANQRGYVLDRMSARNSLYIVEYPGYGPREGEPSEASINAATAEAFKMLRTRFPGVPLCALGESIGSGPASKLAMMPVPPEKIVLIVPFDSLARVAAAKMPLFPVPLLLKDNWDNIDSLKGYGGHLEIFAATADEIIPFAHAANLAANVPGSKLHPIAGGHGWSDTSSPLRLHYQSTATSEP